ncbi:MAG: SDR family oxidoreductase [Burkholderiales bacterium]|nr:SDR family oxidoreductase [Burkholderiales bacterium]
MFSLAGRTAVITGGGSGFGREFALLAHAQDMNVVIADVQADALDRVRAELEAKGARVLTMRTDVSRAPEVQALADATMARFGAPALVFNNAGVGGTGGLIWENTQADWEWTIGVNLWGVIHGVRIFTPLMLAAARRDPAFVGHVVNTASMAGLLTPPNMGVYNTTKHAVVALTETLYQDLHLVTEQVSCSVLCPYFVPTGIFQSERNRPDALAHGAEMTASQRIAREMGQKAVTSGKVSAAEVAALTFEAIARRQFYIYSHPHALGNVETRMRAIVETRNPPDPFAARPEVGAQLRAQLRAG